MTYGSSHRMWESNVHTCENPSASARLASSITRAAGGVVWRTMPMSMRREINPTALQDVQICVCRSAGPGGAGVGADPELLVALGRRAERDPESAAVGLDLLDEAALREARRLPS